MPEADGGPGGPLHTDSLHRAGAAFRGAPGMDQGAESRPAQGAAQDHDHHVTGRRAGA